MTLVIIYWILVKTDTNPENQGLFPLVPSTIESMKEVNPAAIFLTDASVAGIQEADSKIEMVVLRHNQRAVSDAIKPPPVEENYKSFTIVVNPPMSQVIVGGKPMEGAPYIYRLYEKDAKVSIKILEEGYQPVELSVEYGAIKPNDTISVELKKKRKADGEKTEEKTPMPMWQDRVPGVTE
jgi:hypothetical protein